MPIVPNFKSWKRCTLKGSKWIALDSSTIRKLLSVCLNLGMVYILQATRTKSNEAQSKETPFAGNPMQLQTESSTDGVVVLSKDGFLSLEVSCHVQLLVKGRPATFFSIDSFSASSACASWNKSYTNAQSG